MQSDDVNNVHGARNAWTHASGEIEPTLINAGCGPLKTLLPSPTPPRVAPHAKSANDGRSG